MVLFYLIKIFSFFSDKLIISVNFVRKNPLLFFIFGFVCFILILLLDIYNTKNEIKNLILSITELNSLYNEVNAQSLENQLKQQQLLKAAEKAALQDPNQSIYIFILGGCLLVMILKIFGGN